jgi:metal-responsive CopG/Arc/MetJ family transcriptional regulator
MNTKKRNSPKISVTIPREILRDVERIAIEQGRSKSNAISFLLTRGIEIEKQAAAVLAESAGPAYTTNRERKK